MHNFSYKLNIKNHKKKDSSIVKSLQVYCFFIFFLIFKINCDAQPFL